MCIRDRPSTVQSGSFQFSQNNHPVMRGLYSKKVLEGTGLSYASKLIRRQAWCMQRYGSVLQPTSRPCYSMSHAIGTSDFQEMSQNVISNIVC